MAKVTITIPKELAGGDDLVVIRKKELDDLITRAGDSVSAADVLTWSRDARRLRREGKLPKLA